jgi:hypothetical protein
VTQILKKRKPFMGLTLPPSQKFLSIAAKVMVQLSSQMAPDHALKLNRPEAAPGGGKITVRHNAAKA